MEHDQSPIAPHVRIFTPDEANALLADVRPIVRRMRDAEALGRDAGETLRAFAGRLEASGGGRPDASETRAQGALGEASESLRTAFSELAALGISVKDPARGLIDFPCLRDGEIVELCWLDGEPEVAHWHRIGAGF
ncbi:MAG TPA: DUF2203 domain-containing protein, partial [Gaiellales bacterium]